MSRLAALAALVLLACPFPALTCPLHLCKTALGVWHDYVDELEHNELPGQPYWDGNSWDTDSFADDPIYRVNPASAGALLEGHTATLRNGTQVDLGADAPGPADLHFFAGSDDHASPGAHSSPGLFSYTHDEGAARYAIEFLAEITSNADTNEFGWFPANDPASLNPIFVGANKPGDTWRGTLPGDFGFYLWERRQNVIYRTAADPQQFALFLFNEVQYVGMEDRKGLVNRDRFSPPGTSDYDYNDMIVSLQQEAAPEPAMLWLFGMGLTAAAVFIRRAKHAHR